VLLLQWGRVGEDAEVRPRPNRSERSSALQWGRVGEDAEVDGPSEYEQTAAEASMGPRR